LVNRSVALANSGEELDADNGGALRALLFRRGGRPTLPQIKSQPSDCESTITIRRYPFGVKVVRETLGFSQIEPAVLGIFGKRVLLF
jgi:hypothetical protein